MPTLGERLSHAWNAFMNRDPTFSQNEGYSSTTRPDRIRLNYGNDRTIITSIFNRIAVDCAAVDIRHVRVDENGRYLDEIRDSKLNYCLSVEANRDQTGRNLIQQTVMTMFDKGCVAVVPVKTSFNPNITDSYEIKELRAGTIEEWYPQKIKVSIYDEDTGIYKSIIVKKDNAAIIENPFYSLMNAPNGILRRLVRKLSVLDSLDDKTLSGKLDILMRLPYTLKSDARKIQAENRRKELEDQMNSKLGIGYIDSTEQIVQLNRPLENNLMSQVEYLTRMLYSQLGDEEIFKQKANEQVMLNYYTHTIEPIMVAITEEMHRKFLSKTAITQGQAIAFFRDPFKLVTINNIADIGDKFTRNEILTSNEVRAIMGMKPSKEPNADELRNKSLYPEDLPEDYGNMYNINQEDYNIDSQMAEGTNDENAEDDIENYTLDEFYNNILNDEQKEEVNRIIRKAYNERKED